MYKCASLKPIYMTSMVLPMGVYLYICVACFVGDAVSCQVSYYTIIPTLHSSIGSYDDHLI